MSVAEKITAELEDLHAEVTSPGMAAVALALAKSIDDDATPSEMAKSAHELRSIMADLRKLAPVDVKGDAVDDIAEQRARRRAAAGGQSTG